MGKNSENDNEKKVEKQLTGKASVDWPQLVQATDKDPYHNEGDKFDVSSKKAAELEKRGWVKIIGEPRKTVAKGAIASAMIALLMLFNVFTASAQQSVFTDFKNSLSPYALTDTVTNGGTAVVTTPRVPGGGSSVTITATCVKISGTVAGTITLMGSLDGTNFKALAVTESQTALATATATNVATEFFSWHLRSNPYLYYRISWTGTGTMAATIAGKILKH